jgi:hypothetical protein
MSSNEITNLIIFATALSLKFTEQNKYSWFKLDSDNITIVIISIIKIIELSTSIVIAIAFDVT